MDAPFISVVIPVYNAAEYLPACLDSLLAQSFTDWEAVCVNDGSHDDSCRILRTYEARDSRIRVINQENSGVSAARNKGMEEATGEYFTFVDADDELRSRFLEDFINEASQSQADMIVCGVELSYDDASRNRMIYPMNGNEPLHGCMPVNALSLSQMQPFACGKLLKKSLIRNHGLRLIKELKVGEDTTFHYQYMLFANTIAFVPEANYIYWQRGESAWHKFAQGKAAPRSYYDLFKIVTIPMHTLSHRHAENNADWWQEMKRQTLRLTNLLVNCRLCRWKKFLLHLYGTVLCIRCSLHTRPISLLSTLRSSPKSLLHTIRRG